MKEEELREPGPDRFEAVVAAAAARCIRERQVSIEPDTPLALLGLDSLGTLELAGELEHEIGRTLPEDLLCGCADVRSLAARLRALERREPASDPLQRMLADAELPPEVRPLGRGHRETSLARARVILLTGATGFLGAALARELLRSTNARLVCLSRDSGGLSGRSRVRRRLLAAGVEASVVAARVRVLQADLEQPSLGLDPGALDRLARGVDAICHAGAAVNWISPYGGLRQANVQATRELLRLACRAGSIPFHFVSSLSVCYSTSARGEAGEDFDALPHLRGVHLGYAQTKVVAEALVREAGRRGLPVRVYRPALITGDSRTGDYNRDDLITALIRGCVRMGAVPDLDWTLDSLPVDAAARAIVALSGEAGEVYHLVHRRPRHWREVALWMRLYGYPVRLVRYPAWLHQLEAETDPAAIGGASHPLRQLRPFFIARPAGESGLTLPELYEAGRRVRVAHDATCGLLSGAGWTCPPLDASLLETYVAAMRRRGDLPAPRKATGTRQQAAGNRREAAGRAPKVRAARGRAARRAAVDAGESPGFLASLTGLDVVGVEALGAGSDHSIIGELAGWRSRRPTGLLWYRLTLAAGEQRDVVVKLKCGDADVMAVGEALARLCDAEAGDCWAGWQHRLGIASAADREVAIYRQTDPRFVRHAPAVLGTIADAPSSTWAVALERIADATLIDASEDVGSWTPRAVGMAIDGLASLQAIWFGREAELARLPWIGHVHSAAGMAEMSGLWTALARHAEPAFSAWAGPGLAAVHQRLAESPEPWWTPLERGPRTLIHNDFNPRNICIRGAAGSERLCAYDWELATIGAPQRDLAELLCFVLRPDVGREDVETWIWRHHAAVQRETGARIDRDEWLEGFGAALRDLLVNRLAIYALVHRIRRQPFLPRVVRTWQRLHDWADRLGTRNSGRASGLAPRRARRAAILADPDSQVSSAEEVHQ